MATYDGDLFSFANNNLIESIKETSEVLVNNEDIHFEIEKKYIEINSDKKEIDYDAYKLLLNDIKEVLRKQLSVEEFSDIFKINKTQANSWLKRAVEEGYVKNIINLLAIKLYKIFIF